MISYQSLLLSTIVLNDTTLFLRHFQFEWYCTAQLQGNAHWQVARDLLAFCPQVTRELHLSYSRNHKYPSNLLR